MLLTLFRLLSRLPLRVLHAAGAALGWLVYWSDPGYRRRLQENIKGAGYASHLFPAVTEAGRSMLELPFIWCAPAARVLASARLVNWELVETALARGKGVILLTPHLGCFEIAAQGIASKGPLTALYRPPRKAFLKPLIEGARARHNLALAPANLSGVRTLLKTLKQGKMVGLLPDQVPQQGEGVWADFFGRAAYTMTLPAKLHQMTGAPVILCHAERLPGAGGYLIHFSPFEQPLEGSAQEQARAINAAMEALIARCPTQYFWSYNRYKRPAGAPSESATGARE